jgi:hypothetical protein
MKILEKKFRTLMGSVDKRLKRQNMDTSFGTWNIRSLYSTGSPMKVSQELSKCELDLVGVQEARWEGGGTGQATEYILLMRKGE